VKRKVFKLRRVTGDIPCSITLQSAGRVSFQSAGPTTAKARFWDRDVWDQGTRWSQRSTEHSGQVQRADSGLNMSSHRYLGARPCWDLATRSKTSNMGQDWEPVQIITHLSEEGGGCCESDVSDHW